MEAVWRVERAQEVYVRQNSRHLDADVCDIIQGIRKASEIISRDRAGYNCSRQTKGCFDNQFYKKIELLCFEGGNKGGGNYTDNELGFASCKDWGTY